MYTRVVRGQPPNATTLPQSRSPLVCVSRWRIVIVVPYSGSSGRYFRTSSSSESFPSSDRSTIAPAVICFDTEPASNTVRGVIGASCSRSAMP